MVLRDYNQIKDELEEKIDEITALKEDLEIAKGLLSRQQNCLVINSSPISLRPPKTREEASQQEHLPETRVRLNNSIVQKYEIYEN